mmetsp:Transcript_5322/g.8379  ORF Transcript_5322/g.8379 Transcript_5322/m.8379 type:complete len:151 (-) Transcript_5322:137-589(-)
MRDNTTSTGTAAVTATVRRLSSAAVAPNILEENLKPQSSAQLQETTTKSKETVIAPSWRNQPNTTSRPHDSFKQRGQTDDNMDASRQSMSKSPPRPRTSNRQQGNRDHWQQQSSSSLPPPPSSYEQAPIRNASSSAVNRKMSSFQYPARY